jgi:peptidyl-prolyl cis-trans isomerase A (cyclophilin A)
MTKWLSLALFLVASAAAQPELKPLKPGLYAIFKTELGDIRVLLYEKDAPVTVRTFVGLAQGTFPWKDHGKFVRRPPYNDTVFYRVVPDTAIQGGSPSGKAAYDCGFAIQDEMLPGFQFKLGSLAIANTGQPNSGSCQFFFTGGPMHPWYMKYTIFGQAVDGLDVVERLVRIPAHDEDPIHPPKLISVTIQRVGPPPEEKKRKQ